MSDDENVPLLSARGISKHFGPVQALTGVDLDLPAGQVTALCGDNGAGKSVLIKSIAGIHQPDGGEILWEGRPVRIHTPRDASTLGIETVYQDLALADNLDIVQNMFLGREKVRRYMLDENDMERAAATTLAGLGVTTVRSIRQPVASLSGGQRQSVAVARAVMWNSRLVIMDEPTAALGVTQTAMVLDLIRRLRDHGLAVLVVSHNLNDVFAVADRIAVLYLGRMATQQDADLLDRQSVVEYMTTGRLDGATGRTARDRTATDRVATDRAATERTATERTATDRAATAPATTERAPADTTPTEPTDDASALVAVGRGTVEQEGRSPASPGSAGGPATSDAAPSDAAPPGTAPSEAPLSEPPPTAEPDILATTEDGGDVAALVPPEVVAQSLPEYLRGQMLRIRSGESGMLPVVLGLIAIVVVFQILSPGHVFLSAGNVVNLFLQSAVFMVLAMAEIFALLLGEIDLSIGYVGPVGAVIAVQLVQPATTNWPWWAAIIAALVVSAAIGLVQGTLVTRLRLASFIVTLGGLLVFNGVLLIVLNFGPFSGYPSLSGVGPNVHALYNLMWGQVTPLQGWIVLIVVVGLLGATQSVRDVRRRRSGLVAPPLSVTISKIALIAVAGAIVVAVCNVNRAALGTLQGVPWAIFIVLGVLALWTLLLQRTRFGRYVYAIGGNAEAARRAGIRVDRIRTWSFVLCSMTAGIASLLYASYLGGMSNNVNGGQLVLYAVAAAVIGGTSLFGGRGKAAAGVLGGLVIGGIYNGMYLQGLEVQWEYIVTGLVLVAAVAIDALSRRGSSVKV
ncbi:MAG: ABC transporter permease subunit [Intrasporangium sp.]|uniref:ABC transporter permease subunit n=1 Tax=Intrasporangium sp. TaxID=1925024 RepID=UPI003F7F4BFE